MSKTLTYKILENHLLSGELIPGTEITIKMDQTLTQDSTGTMVYLQLEAMDVDRVKTELSVAYIDHNTLQTGFENADDHAFIKVLHNATEFCSQNPATEFVINFIWRIMEFPVKLFWDRTVILRPVAVWV